MNGIHDMGGMHGFGPIVREADEPVFHAEWEARVYAMRRLASAWRRWNIDAGRHAIELMPPAEYLRSSYFEKWLCSLETLLVEKGLVTPDELASGRAAPGSPRLTPPVTADRIAAMVAAGSPSEREAKGPPAFAVGDTVRARQLNSTGHTRLPRYVRGRQGRIERDHGAHVFPDANAHFLGERPQRLYTVCFPARELWGPEADTTDTVRVDLWEPYLESA